MGRLTFDNGNPSSCDFYRAGERDGLIRRNP
jgi:hypothetical protein